MLKDFWKDGVGSKLVAGAIGTIFACIVYPKGDFQAAVLEFIRQNGLYIIIILLAYIVYLIYKSSKLNALPVEKENEISEVAKTETDSIQTEPQVLDLITNVVSKQEIDLVSFITAYNIRMDRLNEELLKEERLAADHKLIGPYQREHRDCAERISEQIKNERKEFTLQIELLRKI